MNSAKWWSLWAQFVIAGLRAGLNGKEASRNASDALAHGYELEARGEAPEMEKGSG